MRTTWERGRRCNSSAFPRALRADNRLRRYVRAPAANLAVVGRTSRAPFGRVGPNLASGPENGAATIGAFTVEVEHVEQPPAVGIGGGFQGLELLAAMLLTASPEIVAA